MLLVVGSLLLASGTLFADAACGRGRYSPAVLGVEATDGVEGVVAVGGAHAVHMMANRATRMRGTLVA